MMTRMLLMVVLLLTLGSAVAGQGGVVLLYHHVSDTTPASTSVTPERFEQHLDYLADNDFAVWPLDRLLDHALDPDADLPERVVAITFDDAYESVYTEAWPRLAEKGWPMTVFVNTDAIDHGHSPYMGWDELRELAEAGVAIENHSATHNHLLHRDEDESMDDWRQRVRADIERAHRRIDDEIGREPTLLAYPYGEESPELRELVEEIGYRALSQRSGAVGPLTDPRAVPRFALAQGFDSMERLALAANARPLPVVSADTRPEMAMGFVQHPRAVELELAEPEGFGLGQLNCFFGTGQRLEIATETGESDARRLSIAVDGIGRPGRNRVNCTAPAGDGSGAFYWYSFQWLQKREDGSWPQG